MGVLIGDDGQKYLSSSTTTIRLTSSQLCTPNQGTKEVQRQATSSQPSQLEKQSWIFVMKYMMITPFKYFTSTSHLVWDYVISFGTRLVLSNCKRNYETILFHLLSDYVIAFGVLLWSYHLSLLNQIAQQYLHTMFRDTRETLEP